MDEPASTAILIMAKAPLPGRTKTRLAATLGDDRAMAVYRRLVARTGAAVAAAGADRVVVHFTPADGEAGVRELFGELGAGWSYTPQIEADLGARMVHAIDGGLREAERVLVVGTDCPTLSGSGLARALELLGALPAVVSPSRDGGYVMIGVSAPAPALFADVAWSTETVLAETIANAQAAAIELALLPPHNDIDSEADLRAWLAEDPTAADVAALLEPPA